MTDNTTEPNYLTKIKTTAEQLRRAHRDAATNPSVHDRLLFAGADRAEMLARELANASSAITMWLERLRDKDSLHLAASTASLVSGSTSFVLAMRIAEQLIGIWSMDDLLRRTARTPDNSTSPAVWLDMIDDLVCSCDGVDGLDQQKVEQAQLAADELREVIGRAS